VKVLVTGSRNWAGGHLIRQVLLDLYQGKGEFTLVHGGAKGVDTIAHLTAMEYRWPRPEVHRPNYGMYGKAAPFIRNRDMVNAGVDWVLAFVARCDKVGCPERGEHGSHGAVNTVTLARNAGLNVRVWQQ